MYHYAYLLTFPNGKKYIGARSFHLKPELDTTYLGSGKALPKDRHDYRDLVQKDILQTFNTREELMEFEKNFIKNNNCIKDESWYNLRLSTFDRHGQKTLNFKQCKYQTTSGSTFKKRYKNYRTPAQIDGAARMRKALTGVSNPAKGLKGVNNNGFNPWYYITPDGQYVEVLDKTKKEMASELGFTERQLGHGFHHTNEHQCAKSMPRKGWTFGNLPRPNIITDRD